VHPVVRLRGGSDRHRAHRRGEGRQPHRWSRPLIRLSTQ
jgi:hypothetical protein